KDLCPDLTQPSVDLFACETSAILAEVLFLLKKELDSLSPTISERVEKEIEQRILLPFEQRSDFPWLQAKNNWTSWCISSIFISATYLINDSKRLAKILKHGLELLQPYIDAYPPDFSCDEGPSYWGVSPGALLIIFETLYARTNGILNVFDSKEFAKMGKYFSDMHINGPWFFNYSDTPAKISRPIVKPYRYGERTKNEELKNLALLALRNWSVDGEPDPSLGFSSDQGNLLYALRELFWVPLDIKPKKLKKSPSIWYHHAQLLITREKRSPDSGFVLAVKGGTNAESHNHIDVGEFLIFADGEPVIVDPGRGEYKRQNFSHERYNIWWNAGRGHNILQFGKHEQALGKTKPTVLDFRDDKKITEIEFDLTATFEKSVNLIYWRRKYTLVRDNKSMIKIVDNFQLQNPVSVSLPLYTVQKFLDSKNSIKFVLSNGRKITLKWSSEFYSESESLPNDDPFLIKFWGGGLMKKITLKSK
ncbi:MAG TPA: heparinase II/III family protein, partial [Victivallales bacterium]|nr:heparinase II/III family protein [Victivallales bacterium]